MKRVVENFRLPFFNYLHILHICAIKIKIMSFIRNIILSVFSLTLLSCNYLETEKFYIGVSQCSYDEWRDKMNSEMQTEAMLSHQITLEIRSADDDSRKQTEDIMYFIKKGVDLLIVSPNEASEVTPAVDKAFDAGIPVIVVDRNVVGDKYTAFISADNTQIGQMQGEYVVDNLEGGEKIIEIKGLTGSTPSLERHNGFIKGLGEFDVEIVASVDAGWRSDIAEKLTDSLLRVYPDVSMIVAQNDRMALGAYMAAERLGLNDIKFIGVDALTGKSLGVDAIINGSLDASILYPTGGDVVIQTALKILDGKSFKRTTTLETALIDRSNARLMSSLSNEIQHQISTIRTLKDEVNIYLERYSAQNIIIGVSVLFLIILGGLILILYKALKKMNILNMTLNKQKETLEEQSCQLLSLNHELEEATHAKLMFFTNVSHDFRTPLTLISDPINQLKSSDNLDSKEKKLLNIADKNVNVLLRLVNQILDFRKYENGKATLNLSGLDLSDCIEKWMDAFSLLAIKKHINVSLNIDKEYDYSNTLDGEKTERIFFNLMANAFKFTPENGTIDVHLTRLVIKESDWHRFTITNSGASISPEYIEHIFERFYQIDSTHSDGSGIGLALVKTFVDMHGGTIHVTSSPKEGTKFTVTLPVTPVSGLMSEPVNLISSERVLSELGEVSVEDEPKAESQPTILIIDDNPDIRTLVGSLFCDEYTVIEAANGTQGIQAAMYNIPDLIICDVMMPGIDGLECCNRLKNEVNTSHIPILMLTACSLDEQRVSGLNCGADAYMAKPFNSAVLIAQVKSLIENRKKVKSVFGDVISLSEETVSKTDKDFLIEFKKAITERLDDSELSVETLGTLFGMSRVQLYRKIKNLTNYTPVEIIRITRLKAAQQLLASTDLTVAEVSYQVGFSSPSYFAKCYKENFGEMPNDTRLRKK